jgi:ribonucleoside-triphosphate reductase (thioredoxin)
MNFPTVYQEFIFKRTYSRWLEDQKRRETWDETVDRYAIFFNKKVPLLNKLLTDFYKATETIRNLQVMPSMRSIWTAGPALEQDNIAGYNCAYTVIDSPKRFAEILYILMNGAGVGFSTERQYINQLPEVPMTIYDIYHNQNQTTIMFEDSKLGWAEGYQQFIQKLYEGYNPICNYSNIRPKGARLKTFGGRASGPEPLKDLVEFTRKTFKNAQGRKLNSIECYDIICKIANCVVAGGVRRSATINLSNLSDLRMRAAKEGQFWIENPQRSLSNNSVAYTEKPDIMAFIEEWTSLIKSRSGERGIVNRPGLTSQIPSRRVKVSDLGVNPCGEIVLRPFQFCNLTEVVVRPEDTLEDLCTKVKYATILGCLQATLTDFKFLSPEWKKNCEEERLLGVSLTGLMNHPVLNHLAYDRCIEYWLKPMKQTAIDTAKEWSEALGISMPAAITCVKPSGTVSQLVNCSSGLHPVYSPYFIRRVRVNAHDAITKLLLAKGVPANPEVGQTWANCDTVVFDFPMKAPEGSVYRNDRTAIEQLEYWKMLKVYWCEHNPSCTIYVKDDEWLKVGAWIYENWDAIGGLSFLPYDGGTYELAPYEEITKEKYEELMQDFPDIDFEGLSKYEQEDETQGSREFACTGGACEIN